MDYLGIIEQIMILFLIIFAGFILRKKNIINKEINKGLSDILLDAVLPALIISSMMVEINRELINNSILITIITIILYAFIITFTILFAGRLSLPDKRKSVFKYLMIFGNVGYMAYPVIGVIYPEHGIYYAIIANTVYNFILWTYGIYLFKKGNTGNTFELKKLLNNGIIATLIGFVLLVTGLRFPSPINGALELMGEMTFPLSMMIIGSSLAGVKAKGIISDKYLFILSLFKLILIPGTVFLLLRQFTLPTIIANISILLLAMPSGANGVLLAERYSSDQEFAAEGVFITTMFSLLTLPLFITLVNIF